MKMVVGCNEVHRVTELVMVGYYGCLDKYSHWGTTSNLVFYVLFTALSRPSY